MAVQTKQRSRPRRRLPRARSGCGSQGQGLRSLSSTPEFAGEPSWTRGKSETESGQPVLLLERVVLYSKGRRPAVDSSGVNQW